MALRHFLTPEAKVRLPNVDEVLNLGYAVHVADDPASGEEARSLARRVLDRFYSLRASNDTETAYLSSAEGIMLSMGRGITRRKQQWEKTLRQAEADRVAELVRLRAERFNNAYLNLIWSLVQPGFLLALGYVTAQIVGLLVPEQVAEATGHRAPSIAFGLLFMLLGKWVSYMLLEKKRDEIELECRARSFQAQLAYDYGKLSEFRLYREQLCEAWKQYTDEEYPQTASYSMIMIGDAETRKRLEQQRESFGKTNIWLLRRIARLIRRNKKLTKNTERVPSTEITAVPASKENDTLRGL